MLEPLVHVELPERLRSIELPGQHARDGALELGATARRRKGGPPQVVLDVEPIVVGPDRTREVAGHAHHPLTEPRREVHTPSDDPRDVGVRERTVLAWLEHRDAGDVHVLRGLLQVEEARVEAREAFRGHTRMLRTRRRARSRVPRDPPPARAPGG